MASAFDFLSAGASLAAMVGVGIQIYTLRRDRARYRPPTRGGTKLPEPTVRADEREAAAPGAAGSWHPAPTPAAPPTVVRTAAPATRAPADNGVGAFIFGLYELFWIVGASGWLFAFDAAQKSAGFTDAQLPSQFRFMAVTLLINGVWAALLLPRHWPARGKGFGDVKDRLWFYLGYAVISPILAIALVVTHTDLIF